MKRGNKIRKGIYFKGLGLWGGIMGRVGIVFAYRNKVAVNLHSGFPLPAFAGTSFAGIT